MGTGIYTSRRKIDWRGIKGFKRKLAFVVATALGAGLFPIAPGTMGTLIAVPLAYLSQGWQWELRLFLWVGMTALGTWAAQIFDETMETSDNQNIVVDEVVGLGITSWTAGTDLRTWIAVFVLFRLFDVIKPPPIRQIDRWSKNQMSKKWRGWGVMADDIVAGFQSLGVVILLQWLHVLT